VVSVGGGGGCGGGSETFVVFFTHTNTHTHTHTHTAGRIKKGVCLDARQQTCTFRCTVTRHHMHHMHLHLATRLPPHPACAKQPLQPAYATQVGK
jgi:hypothetical protein